MSYKEQLIKDLYNIHHDIIDDNFIDDIIKHLNGLPFYSEDNSYYSELIIVDYHNEEVHVTINKYIYRHISENIWLNIIPKNIKSNSIISLHYLEKYMQRKNLNI